MYAYWRSYVVTVGTVFKNRPKSRIQHCERSELRLFSGQKLIKKAQNEKSGLFFKNLKFVVKKCYQTGQFWWKMPKSKICDIMRHFQTL